jgi:hypothetical protein
MVNPLATTGSLPNLPCHCKVNAAAWKNELIMQRQAQCGPEIPRLSSPLGNHPARLVGLCIPKKAESTANDRRTGAWNITETNGLAQ